MAHHDSDNDPKSVILCDNPFDHNTLHTSKSKREGPSTPVRTHFDDTSGDYYSGGSGGAFSVKSETSSIADLDKRSESRPIVLFNESAQDNHEVKNRASLDTLTQDDSGSAVQIVIPCDNTPESDPKTLDIASSSQKEPSTSSDAPSCESADDFSVKSSADYSSIPYGAKYQTSSIDSFDNSSQHDSASEDDEIPQGSQRVAAYASPLQNGRRIRTSCDSIYDLGRWQVDPDGFINEKHRAGGPYLCSLPVTILDLEAGSPLWTVCETVSFIKTILSILEQYGINASSVKIKRCENKHDPEIQPVATLIINATRDTFSNAWVQACRRIWKHLFENNLGHINVEISDPIIHYPFRVLPMGLQDRVRSIHGALIQRIEHDVDLTDCLHYGAMRIGNTKDTKDSEVVMLLKVDFESQRDWRGPRDQIVSILDEFKLPIVGVLIVKGRMWGASFGLTERRKKRENPDVAAQLGL
ncbi:uncharacterized protein N7500_002682 [Penicillium coprophilum]|uniref:uncharacterized protein n=1 Tax=Penicillium coprophilum TaxID=36646 RepID=UPI0023923E8E|nr:uncharacterized protein N7500_002682 [Penicillium coprophilum]KAJ5169899.1 hypothetical protein N7500_002682 [Penicillium coprophilum]